MFTTLFRNRAESKEHINRKKDETFISKKSNQTLIFLENLSLTLTTIFSLCTYKLCVHINCHELILKLFSYICIYKYKFTHFTLLAKKPRCQCKWYESKLHLRYPEIIKYFCFTTYGVITLTLCGNSKKKATMYLCKKCQKSSSKG